MRLPIHLLVHEQRVLIHGRRCIQLAHGFVNKCEVIQCTSVRRVRFAAYTEASKFDG
jgi:hypothetical protein